MSNSRSQVVAFFSQQGSLDQSAIVFSIAQKLAKWQRKLLLVDCDLESYGLQTFVSESGGKKSAATGVPSGLYSLLSAAAVGQRTNWRDHVVALDHPQLSKRVDLLAAGTLSAEILNLTESAEQRPIEETDGLAAYIEALRWDWHAEYDVVLVNCSSTRQMLPSEWMLRLSDATIAFLPADASRLDGIVASIERSLQGLHPQSSHRQVTIVPVTVVNSARSTATIDKTWTPRLVSAFGSYFEPWASGVAATILAEKLVVRLQPGVGKPTLSQTALPECESLARLIAHQFDWTRLDRYPAQWLPQAQSIEQKQASLMADATHLVREAETAHAAGRKVDAVSLSGMAISNWRKCDASLLKGELQGIARAKTLLLAYAKSATASTASVTMETSAADLRVRVFKVALAAALSNLSMLHAQLADQQAAIDTLRDCIALRRELTAMCRKECEPDLARSLHNLAKRLAEAGEKQQAVEAAAEAVAIRRRWARREPAHYATALARSLANLAVRFAEAGASQKAMLAMKEAVRILRRLTRIGVPQAEVDLARTLSNLARILVKNGDQRSGAATMWESIRVWMRVHREQPEHAAELAEALHSFALILAAAGQGLIAVTAAERSVRLMRRLAQRDPARFEPNLARALNTLSNRLAAEGFARRALKAIQQAVEIRTRLAERDPHKYEADLAQSLNNLSNRIASTGNWLKALDAIDMAVTIRSRLSDKHGTEDRRDLAVSLYNRSLRLVEADESGLAMSSVKTTLQSIQRLLVDTNTNADFLVK